VSWQLLANIEIVRPVEAYVEFEGERVEEWPSGQERRGRAAAYIIDGKEAAAERRTWRGSGVRCPP
jgi:hypothetical protein